MTARTRNRKLAARKRVKQRAIRCQAAQPGEDELHLDILYLAVKLLLVALHVTLILLLAATPPVTRGVCQFGKKSSRNMPQEAPVPYAFQNAFKADTDANTDTDTGTGTGTVIHLAASYRRSMFDMVSSVSLVLSTTPIIMSRPAVVAACRITFSCELLSPTTTDVPRIASAERQRRRERKSDGEKRSGGGTREREREKRETIERAERSHTSQQRALTRWLFSVPLKIHARYRHPSSTCAKLRTEKLICD